MHVPGGPGFMSDGASSRDDFELYEAGEGAAGGSVAAEALATPPSKAQAAAEEPGADADNKENAHATAGGGGFGLANVRLANGHGAARSLFEGGGDVD